MTPHTPQPNTATQAAAHQLAEAECMLSQVELFLHAALIGGMVESLEARSAPQHPDGADVATALALQIARTGQPSTAMRQAARKCHGMLRDAIAIGGLPLHQAVQLVQQSPSGNRAFTDYLRALAPEAFAAQGGRS
jgi:hypothetical protein